ncbi:aromatic motif membrane protein [Ureaplasma urealyticum]|uniref:Lipoprotein n=3 Tax=Ureaplasma urealyticum TaxID=2130 RepID=A0AAP9D7D7_UREUR|nr:aromatic motif membrane protein [Ureaplasma urealyticum]EDX53910.1 putative lipoprotein [Ureaplasma urealyticum serovar 9 str. ATCC 33175]ACI59905.1 putative lipoprotein [Ureaplasma urealyticum serovar 10 str. ATCC 33699]EDT49516.1 putative lipoprotein [Ureaplasma urealyticum serovar 13 str. ATCC 33698]EDU06084.1 putative lipoprotein [Ureaplasma urealyticum serovar 5 str. ATCC 27817]EDU56973.1 putative lipoprotein [Ureaplasma urealyticum serovar 7 str. ATCC 27819]
MSKFFKKQHLWKWSLFCLPLVIIPFIISACNNSSLQKQQKLVRNQISFISDGFKNYYVNLAFDQSLKNNKKMIFNVSLIDEKNQKNDLLVKDYIIKDKQILIKLPRLIKWNDRLVITSNNPLFKPINIRIFLDDVIKLDNSIITTKTSVDSQNNWTTFLNNKVIHNLLLSIYPDQKEREEYIKSQQNIKPDYTQEIANWLNYYNTVQNDANKGPVYDKNPKKNKPKKNPFGGGSVSNPFAYQQARKAHNKLFNENWLWFLFNLTKQIFMLYPDDNLFQESSEETVQNLKDSKVNNHSSFYRASSNEFIDGLYVIESSNLDKKPEELDEYTDFSKTAKFALLNKEGFIFTIFIEENYDKTKKLVSRQVSLVPWIKTLPKLMFNDHTIKHDFNLANYTENSYDYNAINFHSPLEIKVYGDQFGGKAIRFSFVDIDSN